MARCPVPVARLLRRPAMRRRRRSVSTVKAATRRPLANAVALAAAVVAAPAAAQSSPPAGIDFTGTWLGIGDDPDVPYRNTPFPNPPPFTARGRELAEHWADPRNNLGARCLRGGGPAGQMNGST